MFAAIMALRRGGSDVRSPQRERSDRRERRRGRHAVAPERFSDAARAAALERQRDPRRAARGEVRAHHRAQRPALEVRAACGRVQRDARPGGVQAHAELDVLDRRPREAAVVEAAGGVERLATDRAEAGPERLGGTGRAGVDVVVQEVAKARDELGRGGRGVVGAEDGGETGISRPGARAGAAARRDGPRRPRRRTRRRRHRPRDAGVACGGRAAAARGRARPRPCAARRSARARRGSGQASAGRRCGNDDRQHVRTA